MNTVQIPVEEYQKMLLTISALQDNEMLERINILVDTLYEIKYGLFMKDFYDDLTEYSVQSGWKDEPSPWDHILLERK